MPHDVTGVLGTLGVIVGLIRLATPSVATIASLFSDKVSRRYARILAAKRSK